MLLKTLKGRHILLLIFVPFIILAFWIPVFINPISLTGDIPQMPLYHLMQVITGHNLLVLNSFGLLLLVLLAFLMVRLNERFVFIRQRTDLPAFILAIIASGTISLKGVHPSLFAAFILFFAIDKMFSVYHDSRTLSKSFDIGLLIGLASLFYLFAALYMVWFCFSLLVLGYFRGREVLAGITGFLTPIFFVVGWYFWFDGLPFFTDTIQRLISVNQLSMQSSLFQDIFWGFLGFLVVISSLYMINVVEEKKISSRKYFMILLIFFLIAVFLYFLIPGAGIELYFIAIIPVTYILSHYFVLQKHRWIGEILFSALILSSVLLAFLR
ncbi:DUF6427 family protein [Ancylomarina longa]|uniref:Glycosyltransferase RgtA/B/C/D-like domain-containing protein n=1 Tax=Ancylomarina longa TaxID=2487017 RepID=A0A434AVD8_9BACT|nr:DUF6427 family protein [Ancylomarina longa]RUT78410.1 hypothetical protein DLK05_08805 [Ancylomarina longa]